MIAATEAQLDDPHHDYPAWDWLIPEGTPIYAVRGGTVASVSTWPHNWWNAGCRRLGDRGCASCGVRTTILDDQGTRWTYCHGRRLFVNVGQHVEAGTQLLESGNTGRSGAPHLHLEIRTNGIRRCPQPFVATLYWEGIGLDSGSLPTSGCSF